MNRKYLLRFALLPFALFAGISFSAHASHLRAGEITVERVGCSGLTFRITVTVFTNTINTDVRFGGLEDWLDFGDNTRILVPEQPNVLRPDLGVGIATASFTINHTYSGNGSYVISYSEPNRNGGVVNMHDSYNTPFYIESRIIADPFLGCNSTPRLRVPPIDQGCVGVAWLHNPGAYDPDGDSLSYELVIPFRDRNTVVARYRDPAAESFYNNFPAGNEAGTGPPSFAINPVNGTITWDAPGKAGEYNIAFVVREWRLVNGVRIPIGFVRRDMQIIITDCDNQRPDLVVPEDICVEAGTTLDATIFGTDPDGDDVRIEAFSEILDLAPAQYPATVSPFPAQFRGSPAQLQFRWITDCSHVKNQPYQVVFKVTDRSPSGSRLVTFKTWNIRVVAPAPEWVSATTDAATRSVTLEWDPYACENAQSIQIWRKVDGYAFEPDSCETGMRDGLGYELIDTVAAHVASYVDDNNEEGLASGAQYCYRLVAVFPLPRGGDSYVSQEICVDPLPASKAIITNVTVDWTNDAETPDGRITVHWTPPFEADPAVYPPPYTYRIERADGFAGDANRSVIAMVADTSFTDTGLNTFAKVYNYRITAVDAEGKSIDPSAAASSVRLEASSELNSIRLSWKASVPWSNQIQTQPHRHLIYRGIEGASDDELTLIDSVDVSIEHFTYLDQGPFDPNQVYGYKVMTRGAYGNIRIAEPLLNFSQMVWAQPGDTLSPCTPLAPVAEDPIQCEAYIRDGGTCDRNVFSNTLRWPGIQDDCQNDVLYYRIWVASTTTGQYVRLPIDVRDTVYVDANLGSRARCYRVQAVDRSGNESELSDPVCFDNCPYYELPNFFTPNGDNCNDFFSAYSAVNRTSAGGENPVPGERCAGALPPDVTAKCARFVNKVVVRIYNRWGKEVFNYESGGERTIYIDWDGRDQKGSELATGIYFYVADVTFDSVDPAKQNQTIKGWVQLLR